MMSELVINVTREESRVALLEGGQVVELYIERKRDASLVGNIYKGKVLKVLPGMQSSFIDIGLEKAAFLYVADIMTEIEEYYSAFLDSEADKLDLYTKLEYRKDRKCLSRCQRTLWAPKARGSLHISHCPEDTLYSCRT